MYEQNYAGGQSTSTTDPDPAPNLTEGWLWRRAKITYDKGWYRLEDGEFFYLGSDPSSQKKGESLGKMSGAVTTSEDRLEFTLCAPLATLEAARLALPRPMPTLASRPPPRGRHGVQDALLQLSRREPEGVQPLDGRLHAPGELRIEVVSRGRLYRWLSRTRHCYVVVLVVGFGSTAGRGPGTRRTRTGARARGGAGAVGRRLRAVHLHFAHVRVSSSFGGYPEYVTTKGGIPEGEGVSFINVVTYGSRVTTH